METANLTGAVSDGTATTASVRASSVASPVTVKAVDENGDVASAEGNVTSTFTLTVPTGHDYVIIVSDNSGIIGAMLYGADHRADFNVPAGATTIDLGDLTVDRGNKSVYSDNSAGEIHGSDHSEISRDDSDGDQIPDAVDPDNTGSDDFDGNTTTGGDATLGGEIFAANCSGCHNSSGGVGGPLGSESASEVAEVLATGASEDGATMPAFPDLVANAADLAAYLSGATSGGNTGGDTGGNTGGGTTLDGAALFTTNCGGCHTGNGMGSGSILDVTGATAQQITDAIATRAAMSGLASLTADQIAAIAAAL